MKNKTLLAFILVFLISGFLPLQSQQCFTFTDDIVVAKGEVQNNVVTFGGKVLVVGEVEESVIAFGGDVVISGSVGELVLGFGANITLKSTAFVEGDVVSLGGILEKEPGCIVKGDTIYFDTSEDITKFLGKLFKGSLFPLLIVLKLISIFIWFLLALLIAAFFPRQVTLASNQIRQSFWPVFGTGALSLIIYVGLVIFSTLLSFLLIGIPILLALIIIGIIIKIFGRVVLFYFFGESLYSAFGAKNKVAPLLAVILGLILVSLISFIPILGSLFTFVLSIIGWGVVIRTKFGTTENWFRKKTPTSAS